MKKWSKKRGGYEPNYYQNNYYKYINSIILKVNHDDRPLATSKILQFIYVFQDIETGS